MTRYGNLPLTGFLHALAANEPVPGGGSAAALAGAAGVSLLLMVAGLPRTRTGAPEETADLAEAAARLRPLRDALTALIDGDCDAYGQVLAALRLPKQSEAYRQQRREALDAALRAATETPLDTMRACQQALRGAVVVAGHAVTTARSDVGVAVELLAAGLQGAALNVDTNLGSLRDAGYIERVRTERQQLEADGLRDADAARQGLR